MSTASHGRTSGMPLDETGFARFAPWIARIVLTMASVIFTVIGLRYIGDPAGASAKTGVTLNTALAYTTTRVGFGAFPLALALFSFTCLISRRQRSATAGTSASRRCCAAIRARYSSLLQHSSPHRECQNRDSRRQRSP